MTQALALAQDLVEFGRDGADLQVLFLGLLMRGFALARIGRLQEVIAYAQQAIELGEAIPDYAGRVGAGVHLGQCYLRQGNLQAALAELETSRRVSLEHHVREPSNNAKLRNGLADAYLLAAEQSDESERADWLNQAGRACTAALKQATAFRGGRPEAMRLQGRYEWLTGQPAAAKKWWQRSLAEAEAKSMRYELGMTHLEMGQRLDERAHLEKAEALFAEIGAELDLARALELLRK